MGLASGRSGYGWAESFGEVLGEEGGLEGNGGSGGGLDRADECGSGFGSGSWPQGGKVGPVLTREVTDPTVTASV